MSSDLFQQIFNIISTILLIVGLYFGKDFILSILKYLLSKFHNIILAIILLGFLNLSGSLLVFTTFHIYASIILSSSELITPFTATVVSSGFTGLFLVTIGILIYKLVK